MQTNDPEFFPTCPSWCVGHDDALEPHPPRWHRSDAVDLAVLERRRAPVDQEETAFVTSNEMLIALEADAQSTYVYLTPDSEEDRSIALTLESATRLAAELASIIERASTQ